jgi:hypothetical protein
MYLCLRGCEYLLKAERSFAGAGARADGDDSRVGYHAKFEYDALMIAIVLAQAARVSNGECGIRGLRHIRTMTRAV